MLSPLLNYPRISKDFLTELIRASRNQPSSISYYRHIFPKKPIVATGLVQAFVIGGTNFEVANARISRNGKLNEVHKLRIKGKIPTFSDAKTFLSFIKKHINPKAQAIAINFAYVLEPTAGKFGEVDGILRVSTKEHVFEGLMNKAVGEAIRNYIKRDIPITVVNDTVCLGTNGLVVGTGCNFSIQGINLEAGNFNKFEATEELETIDKTSAYKGGHRFEKSTAGAYLPYHFNLLAKKQQLALNHVDNSEELSNLAEHDFGAAGDLARALLERSASLVACALAAAYQFSNRKTLTFHTEGSLFWKGYQFKKNVTNQLEKLGVPKGKIRFKKVEDSSMQGALNLLVRTQ